MPGAFDASGEQLRLRNALIKCLRGEHTARPFKITQHRKRQHQESRRQPVQQLQRRVELSVGAAICQLDQSVSSRGKRSQQPEVEYWRKPSGEPSIGKITHRSPPAGFIAVGLPGALGEQHVSAFLITHPRTSKKTRQVRRVVSPPPGEIQEHQTHQRIRQLTQKHCQHQQRYTRTDQRCHNAQK